MKLAPSMTVRLSSRKRRWMTLAALFLGLLTAEGVLRFFLFSGTAFAAEHGQGFRQASLFTPGASDADYWKLMYRFAPQAHKQATSNFDPELGWIKGAIDPTSYVHDDMADLGQRRPVLVYGASFASGVNSNTLSLEGLMRDSDRGERYALINYGVGGYGVDQMLLLYRKTIHLFNGLDPIVVFAPVVESDLDRAMVDFLSRPKPQFAWRRGQLHLDADLSSSSEEFLAEREVGISSFLWRYMLHGTDVPRVEWLLTKAGESSRRDRQRVLVAGILKAIDSEARTHAHDFCFLLFHAQEWIAAEDGTSWQERHLVKNLQALEHRWVDTRPQLLRLARDEPSGLAAAYFQAGPGRNHLSDLGVKACFQALAVSLP